jgi:hypothetical protein
MNDARELGERCLQTGSLKGVDREFEGTKVIFSGRQKIFWRPLKSNAAGGKKYFSDR